MSFLLGNLCTRRIKLVHLGEAWKDYMIVLYEKAGYNEGLIGFVRGESLVHEGIN